MDSKAFHICPFCQSPSPISDTRCARCHRSLAGLPLPVYGSAVDEALSGREPQPLVDLPLREAEVIPAPPPTPVMKPAAPAPPIGRSRPFAERRRMGRGTKIGLATAIMGTALVGGWLVLAHDRSEPPHAEKALAPAVEPSSAPVAPVAATPPLTTAPATTLVAAAATRSSPVARPRARSEVAPASAVAAPPPVARPASRRPAAEPIEDEGPEPPDFESDPVEVSRPVVRARRDRYPEGPADTEDRPVTSRGDVAERLQRAEERRDALAARVSRLRARANASVVTDVEEYQRIQEQLEAALEQQDRLDAQLARLRRMRDRRE